MQKTWICAAILLNASTALGAEQQFICYYNDAMDYTTVGAAPANSVTGEIAKPGFTGDKVYSYIVSARNDSFCPNQVPLGTKKAVTVALVKQESSNCTNDDVSSAEPADLSGSVTVYRVSSRANGANLHLVGGQPDTTYVFFVKCGERLGTVKTDAKGNADRTFNYQPDPSSPSIGFEAAPEGGAGAKLESVKITR